MGNQQATNAFKQYYKKVPTEPERAHILLTPEALLLDKPDLLKALCELVDETMRECST